MSQHITWAFQGDFTGWHTAFAQLPITLTQGNNAVINSVVGADHFNDAVPLHWHNQGTFHAGAEMPLTETWTVRAGYQYANNPVPASTLLPLTAAIMQQAIGTGAGWTHKRWHYDAAYQVQLPTTQSVGKSSILAGEYDNSSLKIWTQSLTPHRPHEVLTPPHHKPKRQRPKAVASFIVLLPTPYSLLPTPYSRLPALRP